MQKVIQTAETGLGASAMAAQESDSNPRETSMISLIPTAVTIFVFIVVTSYIASYGVEVVLNADGTADDAVTRLSGYFKNAEHVVGIFGLIVLSAFIVLSALTTILGFFYDTTKLFKNKSANKNIAIYLVLIIATRNISYIWSKYSI